MLTGSKSQGLFVTPLPLPRQAMLSIHSHHFNTLHDMVYYFYLVFNFPHLEAYCKLVSSNQLTDLPKELTTSVIRKYFPHHRIPSDPKPNNQNGPYLIIRTKHTILPTVAK